MDFLKLSDEDLEWIYPDEPLITAAEKLKQNSSTQIVVVTLGTEVNNN